MTHSINRRDVIAKAGAAAGASLVALPAVALTGEISSEADAALRALFSELEAETAKCQRFSRTLYRIMDEVDEALPPEPPHPHEWKRPEMPRHLHDLYMEATRRVPLSEFWKLDWHPEPVRKWYADVDEEKARAEAVWEEWRDARTRLYEERGFNAADDEYDKHYEKCSALGRRIFAMPAHTLAGLSLKLRAGELLEFDLPDEEPGASIVADIKRLSGVAS